MTEKFYVTTPIYYPNDVPHLGHAYTTIACDIISRWNKLQSKEVLFITGTDEHGRKIEQTAEKQNKTPKEFLDELVPKFKDSWKKLNLNYDLFIRTTDKEHKKIVQEILQKVYDNGDIYLGEYEGYYCTACEAYLTEKDLIKGCCPIHKKKVELIKEKTYFFKLSKYQQKLLKLYEKGFIFPDKRKKEVVNRVQEGLKDLSISREKLKWGIPLPFDKSHVTYVWFDALLNYYSATKKNKNEKFWPADVHIIGKDILWFHSVYWPAIMMAAGLDLSKKIFAHGWWTINGEKMSKTIGNAVGIDKLVSIAGVDSARYFLFRETPFGNDGDFSEKALMNRHNNELADKLGNLISRVTGLIEKNGIEKVENKLLKKLKLKDIENQMENFYFDKALNNIFEFIDICNEYIQDKKPWETKDEKILYELADSIKAVAILLYAFIPETSEKISKHLGFEIKYENINKLIEIKKINKEKIGVLFNKIK